VQRLGVVAIVLVAACGSTDTRAIDAPKVEVAARLPRAPGEFFPSLLQVKGPAAQGDIGEGAMLSDVDSCSSCHPDAAKQWATSAHSFASFGNPIYRVNVELARKELGKTASRHCGGCHDMPLMIDGLMTVDAAIPSDDLRAHSGVTCRLCHGVKEVSKDGNGSYVWSREPLDAPTLGDTASIAKHRAQVSVKSLGTELCVGCHRGFLSPDMGEGMPVHLSGLDEPGMWRNSAWTGNGMGRIDKVEKKTCIDCHMEREPASSGEYGAKSGTIASHRFLGGHTWMASMRGDAEHLRRTQAKLEGAASIDIAGVLENGAWHLPADGAPVERGKQLAIDVVIRNLLVGHRFPGGVLDIQDTWIEVEVADAAGKRLAQSGLDHETNAYDEDTHVLRTLVVDEHGNVLEEHEMPRFRTQIQPQSLAARESQVVRYALDVPADAALPLSVTARLRHRSRTLLMQETVCKASQSPDGKAFLAGARGARDVDLDPCRAQPITLIASTHLEIGAGAHVVPGGRAAWEREYEHGMALVSTVSERLEEAKSVLEKALADVPAGDAGKRPRAMVITQLAMVASKQGRVEDALALVAQARALLPQSPPVLDYIAADALMRVWRWDDAVAPAQALVAKAPQNSVAWMMLSRCLASIGDDAAALGAAVTGLELNPRDPDMLRTQATALAAMHRPEADAALAAYDRFRSPDASAELRISCASDSSRCARERESGHTHVLHAVR
jgi:tetratricopeptide (TPR) repeat protein